MSTVLAAALALAARGVHVFPVIGKRPDGSVTPHGVLDATDDAGRVEAWFAGQNGRGVGVAIGVGSLDGVRVLDVDPRHGGDRNLAAMVERHGPLPTTLTVQTGGGGWHYYFACVRGTYREKLCGARGGIEFLGRGKYVVAPPSIHPDTGRAYEIASDPNVGIARAPAWLLDIARAPAPAPAPSEPIRFSPTLATERARRYVRACDPAISGSHGHDQTFLVAMKLTCGFALDVDTAFAIMATEYNPRCQPAWSDRDLRRKVEQAAASGRMGLGSLLNARRSA